MIRLLFCLGQFPQGCSGLCSALGPFVDEQFEALELHLACGRFLFVLLPLLLGPWDDMCLCVSELRPLSHSRYVTHKKLSPVLDQPE